MILVIREYTRYIHKINGKKCMWRTFRYVVSRRRIQILDVRITKLYLENYIRIVFTGREGQTPSL